MFLYETHLHTSPVSICARASVRENLEFYKRIGYKGVFITNHFIDGNLNIGKDRPYEERINYFFSAYEEAVSLSKEIGIDVFCGIEMSYKGTDFLVYGLDKAWFLAHPEIDDMQKTEELTLMVEAGALIIQAHPFREASYINHIRLFPRHVHGIEVYNANRTDFENRMAKEYADNYFLIHFAGTDNHIGEKQKRFGGIKTETPIKDELDFVLRVKNGEALPFIKEIEQDN